MLFDLKKTREKEKKVLLISFIETILGCVAAVISRFLAWENKGKKEKKVLLISFIEAILGCVAALIS